MKQATSRRKRSPNITKAGILVQPGQWWRDLDKRMSGRVLRVLEVKQGKVLMDGPVKRWVSVRRMHRHSTGWMLDRHSNGWILDRATSEPVGP